MPEPLAGAHRGEQVESADAELERRAQAAAAGGLGGRRARIAARAGRQRALAIERTAERIDDAAQPAVGDRKQVGVAAAGRGHHPGDAAGAHTLERAERHGARQSVAERDDLGVDETAVAHAERDPVAEADVRSDAGDVDREAGCRHHPAFHAEGRDVREFAPEAHKAIFEGDDGHLQPLASAAEE